MILKEKLLERLGKRNCKKQIKEFKIEKVIKRKGDKLYVKWKEYNNLLNPNPPPSWFSFNNSKIVKAVTPGVLHHSVIFF